MVERPLGLVERVFLPGALAFAALGLFTAEPALAQSSDNTLSALGVEVSADGMTFSAVGIWPEFSAGQRSYDTVVSTSHTHVRVTPTANHAGATLRVGKGTNPANLTSLASGETSAAFDLVDGANPIRIQVAAENRATESYYVNVTRGGRVVPSPPRNVQVIAGNGKLTLTWAAPAYWGSFPARGYEVDWYAGASPPADASDWRRATPTPSPLAATVTSYEFTGAYGSHTVANGTAYQLQIRAASTNPDDNSDHLASDWVVGAGTPTAQSLSSNANLSGLTASTATSATGLYASLTLTPSTFSASTTSYTATVADARTHLKITPTVADTGKATVAVGGTTVSSGTASAAIELTPGPNAITVRVTAQNGTTKDYTVTVTRQRSSNANLSGLTASTATSAGGAYTALALTPSTFSPQTTSYAATVANSRTHLKITPTVADTGKATVTVRGTTVTSGTASGAIELNEGANAVTVRVTAQDTTTTRDYTVAVTRRTPAPATLTLSTDAASDTASESGGAVTVTATLDNPARAGGVRVTLAAAAGSTAAATDYRLPAAFTIAEGDSSASADVTLVDDDVDEDNETLVLTATGSGLTVANVTLTITDDDDAGVTVVPTALTVTTVSTATYTAVLDSKPTANVTVTPTSGTPANATVSAPLTFTSSDWDRPKTITVTGVNAGASTVTHAVMSTDSKYSALSVDSVAVTVTQPSKTYAIAPARVTVAEGANARLTVTLGENAPGAGIAFDVTYDYSGSAATDADTGVTPSSLTVSGGATAATLIVPVADDAEVDPGETFTVTIVPAAGVTGWTVAAGGTDTATVTIDDDDRPVDPPDPPGGGGKSPPGGGGQPPPDGGEPPVCTFAAPYWSGPTGGFTVRPAEGRSSVNVTCGTKTTEYMAEDGLVTRLLRGSCPGGLRLEGAAPGGWYWQHGERNAAAAPFVCSEALGGPPAVVPGGVRAKATEDGTWFRHHTARLVGIVPHLEGNECGEYVTPYWQGDGGIVARPAEGRTSVRVRVQCGTTFSTTTLSAGEDGVVAALVRKDWCTDAEGEPKQGRLTVTGAAPGGWYWVDGERNAAAAPLTCADLVGGPAAVRPGGVRSRVTEDGTLFKHEADRLIGIVPHLDADRDGN